MLINKIINMKYSTLINKIINMKYSTHRFDDVISSSRRYMNASGSTRLDGKWVNTNGDYIDISGGLITSKYYADIVINFKSNGSFTSVFPDGVLNGSANDGNNIITWTNLTGQRYVWVKTSISLFSSDLSGTWVAPYNGTLKTVIIANNVISGFDSEPSDINYQNQSSFQTAFASGVYYGKLNSTNNIITWQSATNPNTTVQWIKTVISAPPVLPPPLPTSVPSDLAVGPRGGKFLTEAASLVINKPTNNANDTDSNESAPSGLGVNFNTKAIIGLMVLLAAGAGFYIVTKNN